MDTLLQQQELYFAPISEPFDLARAQIIIRALGFAWQHPHIPSLFLIFHDEESRTQWATTIKHSPNSHLPYVLLIDVKSTEIIVNQFAGPDYAKYSRVFLNWLLANYPCTARNEEGTPLALPEL